MPRRNNAGKAHRQSSEPAGRIAGLGSHWRSDGLPKAAYRTQSDAVTAARMRFEESGVELNVYRCDVCTAWHMGKPRRGQSESD
jgi:hypothetical protein